VGPRDIAIFGIILVKVPRAFYVARVKDAAQSLRTSVRPAYGVFSDPPTLVDVHSVLVTPDMVGDFRGCRVGSCNYKLPATDIARMRDLAAGRDSVAAQKLTAEVRRRMLEYAHDYRLRGNAAMPHYADGGAVDGGDSFGSLLGATRYLFSLPPEFRDYLRDYPRQPPSGVTDVIFWAREVMPRLRPIMSISHLSIYTPSDRKGETLVATKQIYADHYFEAGFQLLALVDRRAAADNAGVYAVVVHRYRFDSLKRGIFSLRGQVTGKMRDATVAELVELKSTYEREFANGKYTRAEDSGKGAEASPRF
jgi:hypothetical protein